tara:strand:+ start:1155 stop:1439 length:285 start_codon:yes stop_codon:yes gene_type:complete
MKLRTQEDGSYVDLDLLAAGTPNCYPSDNLTALKWLENNTAEAYVAPVKTWSENRQAEYAKLNQFEMQFDDQRDSTTTWVDAVNAIKAKYPKPS